MKINNSSKKKIIVFSAFVLVCVVLAWLLFIFLWDLKEKEHFKQMYPDTDSYLQEVYGKYYKKSNILIRGKVTVIFYIDDNFINNNVSSENIDYFLTDESNKIYKHLLADCNGDAKQLEIIFLTYKYHDKYYNFAYNTPMKKTDEMFFRPVS